MGFKLKDGAETAGLPTVTLGGEIYFVPRLTLRHRIAVSGLMPKIKAIVERFPKKEEIAAGATFEIAEDDYNVLVDLVSHGLLQLYPAATREALLDQPIEFDELFASWPVVVQQAASRRHPAGEADPHRAAMGTQVPPTSGSAATTGDGSSQISA